MSAPTVALGEVARIERNSVKPREVSPETPYVGLEHLDPEGGVDWSETLGSSGVTSGKYRFSERHILFGKLRPYLRKIARPKHDGCCSTDILPLLPGERVDRDYLFHYLRHPSTVELATLRSTGANLPRLNPTRLAEFEISLPPLSEQKRIAAILDSADALRAKRRESLHHLDALVQSAFLDMFGDPKGAWETKSVEELVLPEKGSIRTGPFGSQLLHSEFVDEGVRVLGIDNTVGNRFGWGEARFITEQKYEELDRYTVHPGDVLVTIMGTCGRCAIVPDGIGLAINTKHLCCISLDQDRMLPEFLHAYFLHHPDARGYLEQSAKGAIMSGLNMGIIKRLPVWVPPTNLQREWTSIVSRIDVQRELCQNHLAELDTLFASLQSRAFRGEL